MRTLNLKVEVVEEGGLILTVVDDTGTPVARYLAFSHTSDATFLGMTLKGVFQRHSK